MKKMSEIAECAKAIRIELKKKFPEIKFSVTSESFSMGNAVRINWNDGISESALKDIINKYKDGDFDGMTDSYDYRPSNGLPRAKYITTSRHISESNYETGFVMVKKRYDFLIDLDTSSKELFTKRDCWTGHNLLWRAFCKMDLTKGLNANELSKHI
jgi:hypothetical protein